MAAMSSTSDALFTYTLTDGIHHITALQGTGKTVEAILEHIGSLFVDVPMTEKVRIMIDFHLVSMPPIAEWLGPIIAFFRRQGPETGHPARVVYLYSRGARGAILNAFLSVQRFLPQPVTLRFFSEAEITQAREWLHAT
jgi:hypothetical protein